MQSSVLDAERNREIKENSQSIGVEKAQENGILIPVLSLIGSATSSFFGHQIIYL